jgi:hypothetical protein
MLLGDARVAFAGGEVFEVREAIFPVGVQGFQAQPGRDSRRAIRSGGSRPARYATRSSTTHRPSA